MTVQNMLDVYADWLSRWPDKFNSIDELRHELTENRGFSTHTDINEGEYDNLQYGVDRIVWFIVQDHEKSSAIAKMLIAKAKAMDMGVERDMLNILDI